MRIIGWATLLAAGCHGGTDEPLPKLLDTGWFVDTAADTASPGDCPDRFSQSVPAGGEASWYWLDQPVFYTATERQDAYDAWLVDAGGRRLDSTLVWRSTGFVGDLVLTEPLEPSTDYTLWMRDCASTTSVAFRTSLLGTPLEDGASSLVGTTWRLDLVSATWVEPAALAGLLAVYFTKPILLGVQYADRNNIDFLGAPGLVDPLGRIIQDGNAPSWDFPVQSFAGQPYFEAEVSSIALDYVQGNDTVSIPVQDFRLFATIAPDGSYLGGAKLSGLADTRDMGVLLRDEGNPRAICDFAATIGVTCDDCADGLPYCLRLEAEDLDGTRVPGLTLRSQ